MKNLIKNIPIVGSILMYLYSRIISVFRTFPGSEEYWNNRYEAGGNSGGGSYNKMAEFKASIINKFVSDNEIENVIEYGCGDGNQLKLSKYRSYLGFDVSAEAISQCESIFSEDATKSFKLMSDYNDETAHLTLSLDVIYHLVEDKVFFSYMNTLFNSAEKFAIIYSSDTNFTEKYESSHVKHRMFTQWVKDNLPDWKMIIHIPNKYPYKNNSEKGSFADFYIYKKSD